MRLHWHRWHTSDWFVVNPWYGPHRRHEYEHQVCECGKDRLVIRPYKEP